MKTQNEGLTAIYQSPLQACNQNLRSRVRLSQRATAPVKHKTYTHTQCRAHSEAEKREKETRYRLRERGREESRERSRLTLARWRACISNEEFPTRDYNLPPSSEVSHLPIHPCSAIFHSPIFRNFPSIQNSRGRGTAARATADFSRAAAAAAVVVAAAVCLSPVVGCSLDFFSIIFCLR